MIKKLGLQLYTLRDFFKDEEFTDLTFKKMADLGYTEAHTAGTYVAADKFIELAHKHGINFIGTHYDYNEILHNPEETMRIHKMWGTTNIGIGGMPGEARGSADALKKFIYDFNKAAEGYAKHGFKLTYHNHHFEFLRIDGTKTLMDYLYEGLDPATTSFVLDTCWVHAGGGDLRDWMEKLAGRIDILHLKDMMLKSEGGHLFGTMTEVGNGTVNWKGVLETAEKIGVKHYVVEQDANFINNNPFISIKASADYLKQFMA
ncbi:MAG: hypothetical protein DBX61_10635 [Clostridiales bacterium]|nr:MAG: hypothetical protein DBX61_10635 [Clostridiales bacterium]